MIDAYASMPHYAAHIRPVWDALPDGVRGRFVEGKPEKSDNAVIVASYHDQRAARRAEWGPIIAMEHGIGQSYGTNHPAYAGGRDRGDAALFLAPNEHAANRWRATYPDIPVALIGSPRIDQLPRREPFPMDDHGPVVALAWHWNCWVAPETMSAYPYYRSALPELVHTFDTIGHAHPRATLNSAYRRLGVDFVDDFDEVCRRADILVADNTSSLYEFASTGRPVVVLNAPTYRIGKGLGLRFDEASEVGVNVNRPDELVQAVRFALSDPIERRVARESALAHVYQPRTNGAASAVTAILDVARTRQAVAA